jgi:hypothetical protein
LRSRHAPRNTVAFTRGCRTKGVGEAEASGPFERALLCRGSGTQGFEDTSRAVSQENVRALREMYRRRTLADAASLMHPEVEQIGSEVGEHGDLACLRALAAADRVELARLLDPRSPVGGLVAVSPSEAQVDLGRLAAPRVAGVEIAQRRVERRLGRFRDPGPAPLPQAAAA